MAANYETFVDSLRRCLILCKARISPRLATIRKLSFVVKKRFLTSGIFTQIRHNVSLRSELAQLYNDRSILENHHVSTAFRIMQDEDCDILRNLEKEDYQWVASLVEMTFSCLNHGYVRLAEHSIRERYVPTLTNSWTRVVELLVSSAWLIQWYCFFSVTDRNCFDIKSIRS